MKALVFVTLKREVLDPQGEAIRKGCLALGYGTVKGVRQGKLFEIELDADDVASGRLLVEELSDELLANPVIEAFRVERIEP